MIKWTMTEAHKAHAEVHPPRPGYTCGPHAETNGGGCFNCGWKPYETVPVIPYGRGIHVTMWHEGRTLLGEVIAYQNGCLTVHHFNGEAWPVRPTIESVRVLDRERAS